MRPAAEPLPVPPQLLLAAAKQLEFGESTSLSHEGRVYMVAQIPVKADWMRQLEDVALWADADEVHRAVKHMLLSGKDVRVLPIQPLQKLVADRVELDRLLHRGFHAGHPGKHGVKLLRSPSDSRRRLRLVLFAPHDRICSVDERDLDAWAALMPSEDAQSAEVLHMVAVEDHSTLPAKEVALDLLERQAKAHAHDAAIKQLNEVRERRATTKQVERTSLMRELEQRFGERPRVVRAPLSRSSPVARAPEPPRVPQQFSKLWRQLESEGYAVREAPSHLQEADLLAEREEGYPERVVVKHFDALDSGEARAWLLATKRLGSEQAIAVVEEGNEDLPNIFLGTHGKLMMDHIAARTTTRKEDAPWTPRWKHS